MPKIEVKSLSTENIDDEIVCCLGKQLFENPPPEFAAGIEYKRNWLRKQISRYGEAGKIAYRNNEPVGFLEFVPDEIAPITMTEKERFVFVDCYYVLRKEQRKGIGSALINSTIQEFSKAHSWFDNKPAQSIKLIAFEKQDWKNAEPFYKMGFKTELKWLYSGLKHRWIPVLLSFAIQQRERKVRKIEIKLPVHKSFPLSVKVFRSVPCPYGSPNFPWVRKVTSKFGRRVKLEILDMWEKPELTETYGPTPGTVVNDRLVFASPKEYQLVLEKTIKNQLKKLE
ncbi:MAG: GNAT family N-acetyltransferase [Thermoproteota archaeon]|nr:GNAT family N-acetyltransferase [Thermoproteota archaeon]